MQNDLAHMVAERCIDYYYEKIQEENLRKYNRIQKRKELRMKKYKTCGFVCILFILILMCMVLLQMETKVRNQSERVAYLQTELNSVINENEDTKKRLMNMTDYEWIEQEALKLGMCYPSEKNVIYYEKPKDDYMIQTEEIPGKEEK